MSLIPDCLAKDNTTYTNSTDDELVEIQHQTEETNSKQVILAYHGLRMNSDALRFQQHLKTGSFLAVTLRLVQIQRKRF